MRVALLLEGDQRPPNRQRSCSFSISGTCASWTCEPAAEDDSAALQFAPSSSLPLSCALGCSDLLSQLLPTCHKGAPRRPSVCLQPTA